MHPETRPVRRQRPQVYRPEFRSTKCTTVRVHITNRIAEYRTRTDRPYKADCFTLNSTFSFSVKFDPVYLKI